MKVEETRRKEEEKLGKQERFVGKNLVLPLYEFDERLHIQREVFVPPEG